MSLYLNGVSYNPYRLQAIFLQYPADWTDYHISDDNDDFLPLYIGDINFDIDDGMPDYPGYMEISSEEFNEEFDKRIKYFKEKFKI